MFNPVSSQIYIKQMEEIPQIAPSKRVEPQYFDGSLGKWDICYKYDYPYNVLCNFSPSYFVFDGVQINSMEGFLQSLKVEDPKLQEGICKLPGFLAKKMGNYLKRTSQFDRKTLHWQGKTFDRGSKEYENLLNEAYKSKYAYDGEFRKVLAMSEGYTLTHQIGKSDPYDTVLTEEEFIDHLDDLRKTDKNSFTTSILIANCAKVVKYQDNPYPIMSKMKGVQKSLVNDKFICGESLFGKERRHLLTRTTGFKNIVTIGASENSAKAKRVHCAKKGLNYTNIPVNAKDENMEALKNGLFELVDMFNSKGYTYICTNERKDANWPLMLNYLFNPEARLSDAILFGAARKTFIAQTTKIYDSLTEEDKKRLNWDEEFDRTFKERQKNVFEINM